MQTPPTLAEAKNLVSSQTLVSTDSFCLGKNGPGCVQGNSDKCCLLSSSWVYQEPGLGGPRPRHIMLCLVRLGALFRKPQ